MEYRHNVFVSYCNAGFEGDWVKQILIPYLTEELRQVYGVDPKLWYDRKIEDGRDWPSELQQALRHSRLMIAVTSRPYFQSRWCTSEIGSMLARERRYIEGPPLVIQVNYRDGESFPEEIRRRQSVHDFDGLTLFNAAFLRSAAFTKVLRKVQKLAEDIGRRTSSVPEWQPDFPIMEVTSVERFTPHLEKLQ